jgi:hypothetical protein
VGKCVTFYLPNHQGDIFGVSNPLEGVILSDRSGAQGVEGSAVAFIVALKGHEFIRAASS